MSYTTIFSSSLSFNAVLFWMVILFFSCETTHENLSTAESLTEAKSLDSFKKQKGVHLFGRLDSQNIKPFVSNNFEWVTLVPWSDQEDFNSATLNYHKGDSIREIKRDSSWKERIGIVHDAGMKVFLKPHVWIYAPSNGKWRSDIYPENEKNWIEWKNNYREFILRYAQIASDNKVELFCIGTELTRLSLEKERFWIDIIKEVKAIYPGKITYAANWYKEYEEISFWNELDYIGIQAYFPLAKNNYPTVADIAQGWEKHINALEDIHKKYNKKILFTELGYKSTPESAIRPWTWLDYSEDADTQLSIETQSNCYQAFFQKIWNQEWFAGVHIWQMRGDYTRELHDNLDFTPQDKPALDIIAKAFKN